MKYKCQSLASAIFADEKSNVSEEFEKVFDNMTHKSMISENLQTIIDGAQ